MVAIAIVKIEKKIIAITTTTPVDSITGGFRAVVIRRIAVCLNSRCFRSKCSALNSCPWNQKSPPRPYLPSTAASLSSACC